MARFPRFPAGLEEARERGRADGPRLAALARRFILDLFTPSFFADLVRTGIRQALSAP